MAQGGGRAAELARIQAALAGSNNAAAQQASAAAALGMGSGASATGAAPAATPRVPQPYHATPAGVGGVGMGATMAPAGPHATAQVAAAIPGSPNFRQQLDAMAAAQRAVSGHAVPGLDMP